MRNIIRMLTLFVLVCAPIAAEATERPVLRVGAYQNPPKMIVADDGTVHGFHRDLLDALLNEIRAIREETLRIIHSGYIDDPDVNAALERGTAHHLLDKSLNEWELDRIIRVYLATIKRE